MKRKKIWILLALCMLLTACAQSTEPEPGPVPEPLPEASAPEDTTPEVETLLGIELTDELSERELHWLKDLDWLQERWEQLHPDPYHLCSKEEFQWKLERLAAQVGELSDNDLFFEIGSIVIGMDDDVHTMMEVPEYIMDRAFPVIVQFLGDKAYLTCFVEGFEQFAPYLLHEVVAVNGVDMTYLQRKFESFLGPNNSWLSKEHFYDYSTLPAFYDWAGCDYQEGYTFQILNDNQEVVDVEVPALSREEREAFGENITWVRPENWDRLAFMKIGNWAGYFEEETGSYIYLSFADLRDPVKDHYRALAAETVELAAAHPECHKLVIDLRWNPGGDGERLKYFKENMEMLKSGPIEQTYVVVGGYSTSAATVAASFFKGELDAVLIGEPMGQFPSLYKFRQVYAHPQLQLPHSRIEIWVGDYWSSWEEKLSIVNEFGEFPPIAEEYYKEDGYLYDWECTVLPDVYISQDIEDIRQGKDSVIEWVLRQ